MDRPRTPQANLFKKKVKPPVLSPQQDRDSRGFQGKDWIGQPPVAKVPTKAESVSLGD